MDQSHRPTIIHLVPLFVVAVLIQILLSAEPLALDYIPEIQRTESISEITDKDGVQIGNSQEHGHSLMGAGDPGSRIVFRNTERFGVLDGQGKLLAQGRTDGTEAVSIHGTARRNRSDGSVEYTPIEGGRTIRLVPGYPFSLRSRLFVLRADQAGISEYDLRGTLLWQREFASIITCFDADSGMALVGTLDGSVTLISKTGIVKFQKKPQADRCVYGVALSEGAGKLAVIVEGIPQRLMLFVKQRNGEYRAVRTRNLDEVKREQTACAYFAGNSYLAVERFGSISFIDERTGRSIRRPASQMLSPFLRSGDGDPLLFLYTQGEAKKLGGIAARGRLVADSILDDRDLWLDSQSRSLVLTGSAAGIQWKGVLR